MSGGEFDIIERYFSSRVPGRGPGVVLGPGDDCAIIDVPVGTELCVSTDTLIEGVHLPAGVSGPVAAQRSLAANLSDLAAMGARPAGFLLALTIPGDKAEWLDAFAETLSVLATEYGIPLIGGNMARGTLSLTLTVFGTTPASKAIRRGGASPGDDIYVSGFPGEAAAGLRLLQAGETSGSLIARYEAPTPRVDLGKALLGIASAAIDVSDGLIADLKHLATASGVGARIDADAIPLSDTLRATMGDDSLQLALSGGDDYELCFAAPATARPLIAELAESLALSLTRIGIATREPGIVATRAGGEPIDLTGGWDHFDPDRNV